MLSYKLCLRLIIPPNMKVMKKNLKHNLRTMSFFGLLTYENVVEFISEKF